MKRMLPLVLSILFFGNLYSQKTVVWRSVNPKNVSRLQRERPNINQEGELYFTADLQSLKQTLSSAPEKFSNKAGVLVTIPNMEGVLETYTVWENSNFEPQLQSEFPEIRSYAGQGVSDPSARINFSFSPSGIQTMVLRANGDSEFIEAYDKNASAYVLFDTKNRNSHKLPFTCSTIEKKLHNDLTSNPALTNRSSNAQYKTMKLALSCTAEYANYFGATSSAQVSKVLTAMNNTMTRVNGVMETDIAVHLNIIANNASVIYYNASTDPYDVASTGANGSWNAQLMNTLHSVLGDSAFDIGHLFGASGGGGNAGCIGCICSNDMTLDSTQSPPSPVAYKGSGFTSPADGIPSGDNFDIDYVVHEMGHQLGANHTFTFSGEGNNAGTKCDTPQVEPGSGITIMGYAGITNNGTVVTDIDAHSIPIYAYVSINQIQTNLATVSCPVSTTMTNHTPTINAGADYTIPKGTAFKLTAVGSDSDSTDALTYDWEENDVSTKTYNATTILTNSKTFSTKTDGPLFRTFSPVASPERYFPQLSKTLAGTLAVTASNTSTEWESVYSGTTNRTLNFTATVRDNHAGGGQTATDAMVVTVDTTKGPFTVTSQAASGITYAAGSTQTVTWNTANTSTLAGASTVDIYLSTNVNGNSTTFPTLVASGITNTAGTASVLIPANTPASSTCRFMVKASGNIFFAVNSTNFSISALATQDFNLANFSLYPNPNKGTFTIQFDSTSTNDIQISVHDLRGRLVFDKNFDNTGLFSQNISLDSIETGVYLVSIKDGDKKVVKKIVIE